MKQPKNNLFHLKKKAIILLFLSTLALAVIAYFGFFKQTKKESLKDETPATSLKISILNGCGYPGIAKDVKEIIIDKYNYNIDIISWDNVDRNLFIYNKTIIVIKKEDERKLKYLKHLTGINRVIYALNPNTIEDMQIILGKDYKQYF